MALSCSCNNKITIIVTRKNMSGSRSFYKKRNARIFQVGQTLVQSQLNWHYDNDNGSFSSVYGVDFQQVLAHWLVLMALSLMLILNMYLLTGNHWITALNYSFGWKAWTITTGTSLLQIIFCVRHETLFDKILNRGLSSKIVWNTNAMLCSIWYHVYNLKNVKNTHGGISHLKKLQALAWNSTKGNNSP